METETPNVRAAPAGGSAWPVLGAEHRGALTRYAAQLLEGEAAQAPEIVAAAMAQCAADSTGAVVAEKKREEGKTEEGEPDERVVESYFAAVRRQALARLRREGIAQRTAAADGDEPAASLLQRIERLTPKQREAVGLKFSHGFGYEAIAGITGLSVRNVGFLLHSALTHLREAVAPEGRVVAAGDARVTDYVLGEMNEAARTAFEEGLRHDEEAKTATDETRSLAAELEAALANGVDGAVRAKKQRRRGGAGFWKAKGFYAAMGGAGVLGAAVWWWWAAEPGRAPAVVAAETDEFRLKPDAWKLAQARAERGERDARAGVGAGAGRAAALPVGGAAVRADALRARPAEAEPRVVAAGGAVGGGNSGAGSAGGGAAADHGAGAAGASPTPAGAPGAARGGGGGEAGGASAGGEKNGEADVARPTQGAAKEPTLPAAPGRAPGPIPEASGRAAAQKGEGLAGKESAGRGAAAAAAVTGGSGPREPAAESTAMGTLRAALAAKRWPARAKVGAQALLDEMPFDGAVVADGPAVTVAVEVAEAPWAPERRLVRVVVKAAPTRPARSAAANVVFLIDVSASMDAPNRLPLVQETARRLLHNLRPEDRVAIVTYAGDARVALPPTPVAQDAEVRAALAALKPDGMTNGGAGLRRAYEVARAGLAVGSVNRVVLCTDGDFNLGVTSEGELAALVESEARGGVGLAVFGFGRGRRIDPRLEALAAKGRGGSGNVNTRREAERRIVAEVNGWGGVVARDVRVGFDCDPARVAACRLVGGDEHFLPPETVGRRGFEPGELAPGETATALFEVIPRGAGRGSEPAATEWVSLRVGYTAGAGGEVQSLRVPVADTGGRWAEASGDFKFASAVAGLALALGESPPSRERLAAVVAWAEAAAADRATRDPGGYREEFRALAREARELAQEEGGR